MRSHSSLPKLILILILFGALIIVTEFLTREIIIPDQTETIALTNAEQKTKEREQLLLNFFRDAKNTMNSIRASQSFNLFLTEPKLYKERFEHLALTLANSQQDIMKIRYIDKEGMEVVRIDRNGIKGDAKIVERDKLQNKSHRYFFYDSIDKKADQIWFSNLDLNEENGRVEMPYQPTLRTVRECPEFCVTV